MSDQATSAQDWSAYWRGRGSGRGGGAGGEAFAGEGVEQHPALSAYWDAVFANARADAAVLDLACGAGSVLKRAHAAGLGALTGADISEDALALLVAAIPRAAAIVCPADAVLAPDASFDIVTSQFGFEYARPGAADEIARLTAPGGRVQALVHHAGGAIEQEVTQNAAAANAVVETRFAETARDLIAAEFAAKRGLDPSSARAAFAEPARALGEIAKAAPSGLAGHLYGGFKQLYERRAAYDEADIVRWIDGMTAELNAYEGRMATMRAAAKTPAQMDAICQIFGTHGLVDARYEAFTVPGDEAPLAWSLTARRPQ